MVNSETIKRFILIIQVIMAGRMVMIEAVCDRCIFKVGPTHLLY